jgi:hypothetical protein
MYSVNVTTTLCYNFEIEDNSFHENWTLAIKCFERGHMKEFVGIWISALHVTNCMFLWWPGSVVWRFSQPKSGPTFEMRLPVRLVGSLKAEI